MSFTPALNPPVERECVLVENRNGHRLVTTGNDEWYTPRNIMVRARNVLGVIDLDPASCAEANEEVQATRYYTKEDDGMSLPWFGRVWCNPPYGRLASQFTQRLLVEYAQGNVTEGIILVNANALGAKWGQLLWDFTVVCSPSARIHFLKPGGGHTSSTHGSLVGYVGSNPATFAAEFSPLGRIATAYHG